MRIGHLLRESQNWKKGKSISTKYVIVGGGLAGLAAAYSLRQKDCLLFELGNDVGGTASSLEYDGQWLCQGAHYDLAYPPFYGDEVLKMLEEIGIIYFDALKNIWNFRDKQHLVASDKESQTFYNGRYRNDLLEDGEEYERFKKLVKSFYGQMKMPTRLIDKAFHYLNDLDFKSYLEQEWRKPLSANFLRALNYQMIDDYGGTAEEVSALAGLHYYSCRPYYTSDVELLSPPEGNYYFVKKIMAQLPSNLVKTNHLVRKIIPKGNGFLVEVLDLKRQEVLQIKASRVVYAGNKHAVPYIYSPDKHLFKNLQSIPWAVLNLVLKKSIPKQKVFWQNEILSQDSALMGFVNSLAQSQSDDDKQILTAYFCFKPSERANMALWHEANGLEPLIKRTIDALSSYFDLDVSLHLDKVFVKLMGHAMPLPAPQYLFNDPNKLRSNKRLIYAGVDTGRLPLLFEALDSGLQAARFYIAR